MFSVSFDIMHDLTLTIKINLISNIHLNSFLIENDMK